VKILEIRLEFQNFPKKPLNFKSARVYFEVMAKVLDFKVCCGYKGLQGERIPFSKYTSKHTLNSEMWEILVIFEFQKFKKKTQGLLKTLYF
jgi:hypothetical protein